MSQAPTVLVFKKDLISYSETFIAEQARQLHRYRAVFAAFNRVESGLHLVEGIDRVFLSGPGPLGALRRELLKRGRLPGDWRRRLDAVGATLIHAQFGTSGVAALPIARALDLPLLCTFRGFDITSRAKPAYRAGRQRLYRDATLILAVAEHLRDRLIADGCPPERVRRFPTGIRVDRFEADPTPADRPTVAFVGRFVAKKGVAHIAAIFPDLVRRVPDVRLEMVGEGPMKPAMEALRRHHPDNLLLHGRRPPEEVGALLQRAHLFLVPSVVAPNGDSEGLPNVHLEAQAAGLPPVAFDSPGVNEAVIDGETGVLVPTGDEAALLNAVVELLGDRERRERLGRHGRVRVRREFDVRIQCGKLEAIYDEVRGVTP